MSRLLFAAIATAAAMAGIALAAHHPLWPESVLALFLGWCLVVAWRPDLWLLVVLAGLPVFNFSPWSGSFAFDEFDLLVLGAIAGGHARLAAGHLETGTGDYAPMPAVVGTAVFLFVLGSVIALWRGLVDAGGLTFGAFDSYVNPINSVRVFKPLLLAMMLVPLIRAELASSLERAMRRVGAGICVGLAAVSISVLYERLAYPGLTDFTKPYRAVALFWEMHVGGASIDAYLAMAAPFAVWALWSARTPLRWSIAAVLALLVAYACLTTFSRGVYFAVAVPLVFLGAAAKGWTSPMRWRMRAGGVLVAVLLVEVFAVVWTSSFLLDRIVKSDRDMRGRFAHWSRGLGLLHDLSDVALGIGLGRLPAHFSRYVKGYEFSGAIRPPSTTAGQPGVTLDGPLTRRDLAGLFSLSQRVPLRDGARYRVEFEQRVIAKTDLSVQVCELHLMYERHCQARELSAEPGPSSWQHVSAELAGPALEKGIWFAPRQAVFEVSVLGAGEHAEIANLRLEDDAGENLLSNGDFSQGMAHWYPSAQHYFLPWHIDNLYLELLVERGPLVLVAFVAVVGWTQRRLVVLPRRHESIAPFLTASLGGALLIGSLSSVMDAARPAFLLFFVLAFAISLVSSDTATRPSRAVRGAKSCGRPALPGLRRRWT